MKPTRSAKSTDTRRRSATAIAMGGAAAAPGAGWAMAGSSEPQFAQKWADGRLAWPHTGQPDASRVPHWMQKFAPAWLAVPQLSQITVPEPYNGIWSGYALEIWCRQDRPDSTGWNLRLCPRPHISTPDGLQRSDTIPVLHTPAGLPAQT